MVGCSEFVVCSVVACVVSSDGAVDAMVVRGFWVVASVVRDIKTKQLILHTRFQIFKIISSFLFPCFLGGFFLLPIFISFFFKESAFTSLIIHLTESVSKRHQ